MGGPGETLLVCSVLDFCTGKTEQRHLKGVETYQMKGGPKSVFGRSVLCEVFPPPKGAGKLVAAR